VQQYRFQEGQHLGKQSSKHDGKSIVENNIEKDASMTGFKKIN
jgi:hypothetical protein